jgi:DNA-3-methyladenine glycosylase II
MEANIPLLLEQDKIFREIINLYGSPGFVTRPPGFESLCKTILEQQVSLEWAVHLSIN